MKKKLFVIVTLLVIILSIGFAVNAKTVELDFWTFVNDHADYYQKKAEEFNEAHSEINFILTPQVLPYGQMHDKLSIALQTGMGAPDLADIEISQFQGIVANNTESLVVLNSITEKYDDVIIQSRLTPYSLAGDVFGVPTHLGTTLMYYNKSIFEEAGISVEDIDTWEDYVEAGKKITKDTDGDGKIDQWMTSLCIDDASQFVTLAHQFGSYYFDNEGNIILDRKENVEVLSFMQDLIFEHKISSSYSGRGYDNPNFLSQLNDGKIASVFAPQWFMIRFTDFAPDLFGDIVVRKLPAWKSGGTRSGSAGGTGTVITNSSKEPEIAKDFLEFAKLTKEANISIWTEFGLDPFRKDVYNEPALSKRLPYFNNEVVLNTIKDSANEIQPLYLTEEASQVGTLMAEDVLYGVLELQKDPRTLLEKAAEEARKD